MTEPASNNSLPSHVPGRHHWGSVALPVVFGVLLPLAALGIELATGLCASVFFDPIPTIWHALLVALVLCVLGLAGRRNHPRRTAPGRG